MRTALALMFSLVCVVPGSCLDLGQKILDITSSDLFVYSKAQNTQSPQFPDIELILLSRSSTFDSYALLLGAKQNGKIVAYYGVVESDSSQAYFVYDTDGDGVLGYRNANVFLPNWVLFAADVPRSDPKQFSDICLSLYKQYDRQIRPDTDFFEEFVQTLLTLVKDERTTNRDLYLSLLAYFQYSKDQPFLGKQTLLCAYRHLELAHRDVTLIDFYLGIAYKELGAYSEAKEMFGKLRSKSLVADYYLADIESRQSHDSSSLEEFRGKNPDFWIVKQRWP